MYVYFYLLVRAALVSLDASQLEAAASLGAGRWRTLRRVVVPHLKPALAGAALLTFMTALGSFSAPYVFGGGFRVMPTQIVSTRLNGENQLAMVETASLTALALLALLVFRSGAGADRAAAAGRARAPARIAIRRPLGPARRGCRRLGPGRSCCSCRISRWCWSPSFRSGTWTTEPLPPAYTVRNYLALVEDPVRVRPLVNSIWLATVATLAAVGIALAGALLSARRRTGAAARHRGTRSRCRGPCPVPCSPSRWRPRSACGSPWRVASSWWGPCGSCRWPTSYGTCRSPAAPSRRACAPSIPRWTRRPRAWARGAGGRCGG